MCMCTCIHIHIHVHESEESLRLQDIVIGIDSSDEGTMNTYTSRLLAKKG